MERLFAGAVNELPNKLTSVHALNACTTKPAQQHTRKPSHSSYSVKKYT